MRGVLHIHSTWSDGELSLAELRAVYAASGHRFAFVTDHADAFADDRDHVRLRAYAAECDARSDDRFRFIAGLEYSCVDRMHVLGYGTVARIDDTDPQRVIRRIRELHGIAVVAHPKDTAFDAIERFDPPPDGIEVWNSKYDGRYAPRPATFALVGRLRARHPGLRAYYGQDLHWKRQYRGLSVDVQCATNERRTLMDALVAGRFAGIRDGCTLPSDGQLSADLLAQFDRVHRRSQRMRGGMRWLKERLIGLGLSVPRPVKAQLRRIF